MEIVLFRHGIAVPRSPGLRDAQRALTDEGIEKTRQVVKGLAKLMGKPDVIVTSPLLRAKQTAEIASERFGTDVTEDALLGEGRATSVVKMLSGIDAKRVIAVGHEPDLSGAAELLCFRQIKGRLVLKKAGAVMVQSAQRFNASDPSAELVWIATPKMLRGMGR